MFVARCEEKASDRGKTQTNTRKGRIGGEQVVGARKEEEVEDYFYVELRLQPVEIPYA